MVGLLVRRLGDLDTAEELAQDTMLKALEHWRDTGIPPNPAAWLMVTAKNLATDWLRRQQTAASVAREIQLGADEASTAQEDSSVNMNDLDDDVLRLMYIACHPLLPAESRVALSLRLVNGLGTAEIARAYLQPERTIAQRITRAKRTLKAARVTFALPTEAERRPRTNAVLEAIYPIYNGGYTASSGLTWAQPRLCHEALRLARSLAALVRDDVEVQGLAALLEFQTSRLEARIDSVGAPVLLQDHIRSLWDRLLIRRGFAYLEVAFSLNQSIGSYCLQAAIAACHARAETWEATDWEEIVALYDGLMQAAPSAVVALNRAVAVGMAQGPAAALELVEKLMLEPALTHYHLLPAVHGDLLLKLGLAEEAKGSFREAIVLTKNEQERLLLERQRENCEQFLLNDSTRR